MMRECGLACASVILGVQVFAQVLHLCVAISEVPVKRRSAVSLAHRGIHER